MITLLFIILLVGLIFNIFKIGLKLTWGLVKFVIGVVLFPLLIIAIAFGGFFYIAFVILIVAGIISLIGNLVHE